jgi:hypothetical protein
MTTPVAAQQHRFQTRSMMVGLALTLVIDIGLSIAIFDVLLARGSSPTVAYLVAGTAPLLGMAINWARTRKLGGVSIIVLVTLAISALVSLVGNQDPQVLLLKDSVLTGGFGIVTLASALPLFPKPLMFAYGLKFGTDGTKAGVQQWYDLWDRYPNFRRTQYLINNTWGIAYVLEAGIKVACTFLLPFSTAYAVNQILPFVVLAGLIFWTMWYGIRQRKAGERRAAAAAAAEAEAEAESKDEVTSAQPPA